MGTVFTAIGRFAVRFRWLVLAIWLIGTAAAVAFLPSLASVTQNDNSQFLPASAPSMHAAALAGPLEQGHNLVPITVLVARERGQLDAADDTAVTSLSKALGHVSSVVGVRDLGRSTDGAAEQLQTLSSVNQSDPTAQQTLVTGLRRAISATALPSGLQAHLTGAIAENVDNNAQSNNSGDKVEGLSVLFIIVLLVLIFRSLLAPLLTLAPAFLVVELAGPIIAAASHAGIKVSGLAQLMLIVLVLGAGTDYGLFLVFRVREAIRSGLAPRAAVIHSVAKVGESITFSAGTVIAALLSLLAASFGLYADLGVPLAIGVGLMLLAGLTLLPALLAIFGRAVFWPSKIKPGARRTGLWGRVSARIVRRPAVTLVAGLILFGGLAFAALGYQPAGFGGDTAAPSGSDSAAGSAALAAHFPTTNANPTNLIFQLNNPVWQDPAGAATATTQLHADTADFTTVAGPLDPTGASLTPAQFSQLHATLGAPATLPAVPPPGHDISPLAYQEYRASAQFVSADGRTIQYAVGLRAGDPAGTAALNAVPALRAETSRIAGVLGAADSAVGGEAAALYDVSDVSTNDLKVVIPIAIVVIALLLGLVLRSVVAPLYLIVSVGLSYLAALGLAVLIFMKLGGGTGLTFILPFLMFLFLLALGEDYNILVMTRIREEAARLPLKEAVSKALAATGTTVTSAGLVLAGTFAVFAIAGGSSGGGQIQDVGAGIALGVLMDTFLVRTLLVPSTVVLLGRWNWWPARLSRRSAAPPPQPHAAEPVPDRVH